LGSFKWKNHEAMPDFFLPALNILEHQGYIKHRLVERYVSWIRLSFVGFVPFEDFVSNLFFISLLCRKCKDLIDGKACIDIDSIRCYDTSRSGLCACAAAYGDIPSAAISGARSNTNGTAGRTPNSAIDPNRDHPGTRKHASLAG
jgi:hypothetical protein